MKPAQPKPMRCAVYTRKSTEHNLDLAFNSLDAQRESCEAYVKSQAHEGWSLLPERYGDGGLSGASLNRPALQRLLAEIQCGKVDIVVVYKVDRLTRALADFAKLVETFDAHGVAFVSVTQSFNTTSSMGRLTLNVLLSFAQFEREVIGERVRDKIAASKRKGLWVGGPVPLGYRSEAKTLVVDPEEARIVRTIFERYLAVGSTRLLIEDLYQRGISPRGRPGSGQPAAGGDARRFLAGPLGHILKNRFYIGEIAYRDEVHAGQHEPIMDRVTFAAVQDRLRDATVGRRTSRSGPAALLAWLLYDDRGHRMTPSHANKRGARYRYYVSQAVMQNRLTDAGSRTRVAAPDIEALVVDVVRDKLAPRTAQTPGRTRATLVPHTTLGEPEIIARVQRIVLAATEVTIFLHGPDVNGRSTGLASASDIEASARPSEQVPADGSASIVLTVPWARRGRSARKGIASEPSGDGPLDPETRKTLLMAIGKARLWVQDLLDGRAESLETIAQREDRGERHIRLLAPLAFVSPQIIAAIADGTAPAGMTVTALARALPHAWSEQERKIGIA